MDISEEFLSHAAECKRMAQSARDSADKVTWDEMAEMACICTAARHPHESARADIACARLIIRDCSPGPVFGLTNSRCRTLPRLS